ncbi:MAG: PDZ domain-containing protein, partial [Bacteroidota bacterium]
RSFYTGLNVRPVNARIAQALGLDDARGLIVASVDSDSPADRAGLQAYDVIVTIQGEPVASNDEVRQRLVDNRAGDIVRLGIVRDGQEQDVSLTLGTTG